tara:strand:+ start:1619 stop:1786 length:168 start_codon:yes stop_codon:yes gene_type:complete
LKKRLYADGVGALFGRMKIKPLTHFWGVLNVMNVIVDMVLKWIYQISEENTADLN